MLNENIKTIRKSKGLSQEELAIRLNVVRQTVSKWESGLSVPDSELLIRIAEELDTSVNVLLDETVKPDDNSELRVIANKLEVLNEQIAKQAEFRRKIWRALFIAVFVVAACVMLRSLISFVCFKIAMNSGNIIVSTVGGSDGPVSTVIAKTIFQLTPYIFLMAVAAVSLVGIYKTRKK